MKKKIVHCVYEAYDVESGNFGKKKREKKVKQNIIE
jgi:hypothetical protein